MPLNPIKSTTVRTYIELEHPQMITFHIGPLRSSVQNEHHPLKVWGRKDDSFHLQNFKTDSSSGKSKKLISSHMAATICQFPSPRNTDEVRLLFTLMSSNRILINRSPISPVLSNGQAAEYDHIFPREMTDRLYTYTVKISGIRHWVC